MTTNDPIIEVLREIKSELVATRTDIGQLVRHAEHANMRLDEHSAILHEHSTILVDECERRLDALEHGDDR